MRGRRERVNVLFRQAPTGPNSRGPAGGRGEEEIGKFSSVNRSQLEHRQKKKKEVEKLQNKQEVQ